MAHHQAFTVANIIALDSLNLKVESIDSWGQDKLVVGTVEGLVLIYSVVHNPTNIDMPFTVVLMETKKKFSKKPVEQINVIDHLEIVVSLTDGYVFVHDLGSFTQKARLDATKGANLYALDTTDAQCPQLCVAVRKKLVILRWNSQSETFVQSKELAIPDTARALAWCGQNVCIGFRREYNLIHIVSGQMTELFPTGQRGGEPMATVLPNDEVLLGKDNVSVFIGFDGKPTRRYGLSWSETPLVVGYSFPYVLAILPRYIEIRTVETQALVQSISTLKNTKLLCCKNYVYVASQSNVYRLVSVALDVQVDSLAENKQFEEAMNLTMRISDMSDEQKMEKLISTKTLWAYHLFSIGQYDKSVKLLRELGVDPPQVIGMFPDLLPSDLRQSFTYPIEIRSLEGENLQTAMKALTEYLVTIRNDIDQGTNGRALIPAPPPPDAKGQQAAQPQPQYPTPPREIEVGQPLRQIIDTTLLKTYLKTNVSLVGPFLRIPNHCHVDECEAVLIQHQRWADLVDLYRGKNLHRKSLDLLSRLGQQQKGPMSGVFETIRYLQRLGADSIDLILEFSQWIMREDPDEGLSIFIEDKTEVDSLPQERVLAHLEQIAPRVVAKYLEHVINNKKSTNPTFHNKLVFLYLDGITPLLNQMDQQAKQRREQKPVMVKDEAGPLGQMRTKLSRFLEASKCYAPEKMLSKFPFDDLCEERAILLSRIGQHDQALAIYAHKLGNPAMALEYCERNYNKDSEESRDVYLALLKVYLIPPPDKSGAAVTTSAMTTAALDVLKRHYDSINTAKALELLPTTVPIASLLPYLEAVMDRNTTQRRDTLVVKSLLKSEHIQVRENLINIRSRVVRIGDERACPVCHKRIGTSVFVCYPNDIVVHMWCSKDRKVCPVTGTKFGKITK